MCRRGALTGLAHAACTCTRVRSRRTDSSGSSRPSALAPRGWVCARFTPRVSQVRLPEARRGTCACARYSLRRLSAHDCFVCITNSGAVGLARDDRMPRRRRRNAACGPWRRRPGGRGGARPHISSDRVRRCSTCAFANAGGGDRGRERRRARLRAVPRPVRPRIRVRPARVVVLVIQIQNSKYACNVDGAQVRALRRRGRGRGFAALSHGAGDLYQGTAACASVWLRGSGDRGLFRRHARASGRTLACSTCSYTTTRTPPRTRAPAPARHACAPDCVV